MFISKFGFGFSQKSHFFAEFFGKNILRIITSVPGFLSSLTRLSIFMHWNRCSNNRRSTTRKSFGKKFLCDLRRAEPCRADRLSVRKLSCLLLSLAATGNNRRYLTWGRFDNELVFVSFSREFTIGIKKNSWVCMQSEKVSLEIMAFKQNNTMLTKGVIATNANWNLMDRNLLWKNSLQTETVPNKRYFRNSWWGISEAGGFANVRPLELFPQEQQNLFLKRQIFWLKNGGFKRNDASWLKKLTQHWFSR
jgi:hypothetical protein